MPLEDEDHAADMWVDPSQGGVLGRVLEAAETGDEDVLAVALPALTVSVDATGPDGDTALHLASLYGHARCVEMLLGAGASVTVRDADGGTPLHDASAGGFEPIVRMLLAAAGTDGAADAANARDGDGEAPLHMAARGVPGMCARAAERGREAGREVGRGALPVELRRRGIRARGDAPKGGVTRFASYTRGRRGSSYTS